MKGVYYKRKNEKKPKKQRRWEETFGSDGWVYVIYIDDGFMGVYLSPNTVSFVYI